MSASEDAPDQQDDGNNDGLSEYERLRLQRIQRNEDRLKQLGLLDLNKAARKSSIHGGAGTKRKRSSTGSSTTHNNNPNKQKHDPSRKQPRREAKTKVVQVPEPQRNGGAGALDLRKLRATKIKKGGRCGTCTGCTRELDCGTCVYCVERMNGSKVNPRRCLFKSCFHKEGEQTKGANEATTVNHKNNQNNSDEKAKEDTHSDVCNVCQDGGDLILCGGCDRGFHSNCHTPKIKKLPDDDWLCMECLPPGVLAAITPKERKLVKVRLVESLSHCAVCFQVCFDTNIVPVVVAASSDTGTKGIPVATTTSTTATRTEQKQQPQEPPVVCDKPDTNSIPAKSTSTTDQQQQHAQQEPLVVCDKPNTNSISKPTTTTEQQQQQQQQDPSVAVCDEVCFDINVNPSVTATDQQQKKPESSVVCGEVCVDANGVSPSATTSEQQQKQPESVCVDANANPTTIATEQQQNQKVSIVCDSMVYFETNINPMAATATTTEQQLPQQQPSVQSDDKVNIDTNINPVAKATAMTTEQQKQQEPSVQCKACDRHFHLGCHDPPLEAKLKMGVAARWWRCATCKAADAPFLKHHLVVRQPKAVKDKQPAAKKQVAKKNLKLFEGEHDDDCYICFNGGVLVCCDFCPKAFHCQCHIPGLPAIPPGIWKCCECYASERSRKTRCGECEACLAEDCGKCKFCLDKPKFGGKNTIKKPCVQRECPYQSFAETFVAGKIPGEITHAPPKVKKDRRDSAKA